MKNYILSTDVGGAEDVIAYTKGYLVKPDDVNCAEKLALELQRIINLSNDELNALTPENNREEMTWDAIMEHNRGILKLIQES